jgi:class 3 adenylate cyclase
MGSAAQRNAVQEKRGKMSRPIIEWLDTDGSLRQRSLQDKLFLGRICRGVDEDKCIQINHPTVSRDHAVIQISRFGLEITDLSTNGTWVNGVRMAPGATRQLNDGDAIVLGEVTLTLRGQDSTPQRPDGGWGDQTEISPSIVWVTSLVADVRGFSAMCQSIDSGATYGLMKEVFGRFSEVVSNCNGTVKDYAGDAVFAFWEHAQGKAAAQALSACRAALAQEATVGEIRHLLGRDHAAFGELRLGWGITTGPATLSNYGTRPASLAVVGDCVNLAFRLSATANKEIDSSIIMDRQTSQLVGNDLNLRDLGRIPTKGREGLEQIYGIVKA